MPSHQHTKFDDVAYGDWPEYRINAANLYRHQGVRLRPQKPRGRPTYKSTKELVFVMALGAALVLFVTYK